VPPPPTVAVDLRALVPEATGIGVYTRALLEVLAAPGRPGGGFRYLGLSQRPVRGAAELAARGVALETQPAPLGVLWQQTRLPARLAAGDVDLLWSPLATLPWRCPVPAVVTVHDLTAILFPEAHTAKVRWSLLPFLGRSLATARRVVAISQATADDVAFHFPEARSKLRVVPNGLDPRFRPGTVEAIAATRAALGTPDGYLLAVGTLEPRKNLPTLLAAWEALADADPATPPLILAGGAGWETRSFRRRLAALEPRGLRHLGRVDDDRLLALYQAATVFAYPSLYEGFGLPVLEAMACGVPVVTSDVSSLPEVAGGAALLVDPRDAKALAAALHRLLTEPGLHRDLAARGLERAKAFSWEKTAAGMEEVFREALDEV
jgi:glycosyltransferase involved in cell wall biosynthesis